MDSLLPKVENWFDFYDVHQEMLSDRRRVEAYERSIKRVVRNGDVVVDVGTGTGLLAWLCIQAGAKKVYAIESRKIINVAKEIAQHNGYDKIEFIRGDSKDVELPERADVLVSEVIGHCVLDENMLDSILDARSRFLKKSGKMIPSNARLIFAPVNSESSYKELSFWKKQIARTSLSPAWHRVVNTVYVERFKPHQLLAHPKTFQKIDFREIDEVDLDNEMRFIITRAGVLHGFAGWFKAVLANGESRTDISTDPSSPETHWKCAFFPIENVTEVECDDKILFRCKCYSTGSNTIWEWNGKLRRMGKTIMTFAQSTELY